MSFPDPDAQNADVTIPKKLEPWLDALPRAHIQESARQVGDLLATLNRQTLKPGKRLDTLVQLEPITHYLANEVSSRLTGRSLPLSKSENLLSQTLDRVITELAVGYTLALEDLLAPTRFHPRRDTVAKAVFRALFWLGTRQRARLALYQPAPEKLWRNMHLLYRYAADNHLTGMAFGKYPESRRSEFQTIGSLYKQSVLLAAINCHQFSQPEIEQIFEVLELWEPYCHLIPPSLAAELPSRTFVIDLERDSPPQARDRFGDGIAESGNTAILVFDTTELVNAIQSELAAMNGSSQGPAALTSGLPLATLQRILTTLTGMKRHFPRHRRYRRITATIGLTETFMRLSQSGNIHRPTASKPVVQKAVFETVSADDDVIPGSELDFDWDFDSFLTQRRREPMPVTNETGGSQESADAAQSFYITNESAGGCCMICRPGQHATTKVGDIVCIHGDAGRNHNHTLCLIRWIRNDGAMVAMGCEIIGPHAIPIQASPIQNTAVAASTLECILIPAVKELKKPALLVTPPGIQRGDIIELEGRQLAGIVEITNIPETTAVCHLCRFRIVEKR